MIRLGCVGVHPEGEQFFTTDQTAELLCLRNFNLKFISVPFEPASVDVLLVSANTLNELSARIDLQSKVWVLYSSDPTDALRAWQTGASAFLLHPFSTTDLDRVLTRAAQIFYWMTRPDETFRELPQLDLHLTKGRRLSIPCADILYLEARGEITHVFLDRPGQEKLVAMRNLGFWERQLASEGFIRIHKKFVVNPAQVSGIFFEEIKVREHTLPIAKRRRKEVESALFLQNLNAGQGSFPYTNE